MYAPRFQRLGMEPYSQRTRRRIIALYKAGEDTTDIAAEVGGCVSGVRRVRQRFEETGSLEPRKAKPGAKPKLDVDALKRMADRVAAKPDVTLAELREFVGVQLDLSAYCRALKKLGLTRKKKRSAPPSRTGPT
jgi:transposase